MALTETDIRIIIAAELKKQGFDKAQKATNNLDKTFKKLAATIGLTFSATAVVAFGKASMKAFADDEKAAKRLTQTLGNMGLAFEDPRVKDFIAKMEATSGVLDDQLRPAMQSLLTTTGSVAKSQQLLALALDVSAGTGEDVVSVAQDLSKAYVGNTKGLVKYNLGLTKAELSSKSFSEIQAIITKQFSGQNAAFLDTYAGKIAQLNVAYANMQETIGKSLVEAFSLLAGKNGIAGATEAMNNFATQVADTVTGVAILIDKIKSIPGLSTLLEGFNMSNFGILGVLEALGKQNRTAPKPFSVGMSVSGATDFYTKQERDRKKAEEAAAKRAKALAALQKKAELERLKREKEAQQLKRAGSIFDMENIQIVAAMQGQIDGEQRLRLVALLALNNGIADAAEKASTAVLAINAPALASLGVIIKAGDTIQDVIAKLVVSQAKVALIDLGITNLPKAKNPFDAWDEILKNIISQLDTIAAKIRNMPTAGGKVTTTTTTTTPSTTTTTTTTPNPITNPPGGNARGEYTVNPPFLEPLFGGNYAPGTITSLPGMGGVGRGEYSAIISTAASAAMGSVLRGEYQGSNPFYAYGMGGARRGEYAGDTTVNVTVQGSVIAEQDLTATILDNLYDYQRAGQGIVLSSVSI